MVKSDVCVGVGGNSYLKQMNTNTLNFMHLISIT